MLRYWLDLYYEHVDEMFWPWVWAWEDYLER
jgi:hypothetical protein